jgi:hypothetical protein
LLTAIHQNRLGHVSRVVSSKRAPIADQMSRAGVPMQGAPSFESEERVILIFAAEQRHMGARLMLEHGARRAWTVTRSGIWTEIDDVIVAPDSPSRHPGQVPSTAVAEPEVAADI